MKVSKRMVRCASGLLPLDFMLRASQCITRVLARLLFIRDWQLEAQGRPQFFKHSINLALWPFDPSKWAFAARGVYAREAMHRGCKVLDICCGDGTYSLLFLSDIAGRVDAIDLDDKAIAYARRFHTAANVNYQQLDIIKQQFPSSGYDLVVWNAAICYFNESDIRSIIHKIIDASAPDAKLIGMCPKANGWIDHQTEFSATAAISDFLRQFYAQVAVREIDEGSIVSFYFQASQPHKNLRSLS